MGQVMDGAGDGWGRCQLSSVLVLNRIDAEIIGEVNLKV